MWAIGSGLTPTVAQVEEVHTALRKALMRRFGDEGTKCVFFMAIGETRQCD